MAPSSNLAADPSTGNSTAPCPVRCQHCGTPPVRRPKRQLPDCGLVQLKLSRSAATRKHLRMLVYASKLPQSEFAQYVLGVDDATVYRYLHGAVIPQSKAVQLRNIVDIKREGTYIHLTIRTCAERTRWNTMILRRNREARA